MRSASMGNVMTGKILFFGELDALWVSLRKPISDTIYDANSTSNHKHAFAMIVQDSISMHLLQNELSQASPVRRASFRDSLHDYEHNAIDVRYLHLLNVLCASATAMARRGSQPPIVSRGFLSWSVVTLAISETTVLSCPDEGL